MGICVKSRSDRAIWVFGVHLILLTHLGVLLGCSSPEASVQEESSQALFDKVTAVWTRGGKPEELAAVRTTIERRAGAADDSDYALSCARLQATPANIEKEENYYEFLVRLTSAVGIKLVCNPTAKERLVGQKDPPVVRVGSALQALSIIDKYSSMHRLGLHFGRYPDRIEVTLLD